MSDDLQIVPTKKGDVIAERQEHPAFPADAELNDPNIDYIESNDDLNPVTADLDEGMDDDISSDYDEEDENIPGEKDAMGAPIDDVKSEIDGLEFDEETDEDPNLPEE